jgi:chromosome segregation ATPase
MAYTTKERREIMAESRAFLEEKGALIYKTRDDALVPRTADTLPTRSAVPRDLDDRFEAFEQAIGEAMSEYFHEEIGPLKRELESLRFEVAALREERQLQRELEGLRGEVKASRAEIPKLPAIASHLEAETARLRRELDALKDRHVRLRTDWSQTNHGLGELRKKTEAAARAAAPVEMEIETSMSRFSVNIHPDAAAALRAFAEAELIDVNAMSLLPSAGTQ